jgi:carbamoyltransferase
VDTYLGGDISKIDMVVFAFEKVGYAEFLDANDLWETPKNLEFYWNIQWKNLDTTKIRSPFRYFLACLCVGIGPSNSEQKIKFKTKIFNIAYNLLVMNKSFSAVRGIISKIRQKKCTAKFEKALGVDKSKFVFIHHHKAHNICALYFIDDCKTHLMFSMDGYGDGLSSSVAVWNGKDYQVISSSPENASVGHLYADVTGFLGMKPGEHEFKVMGMAPYAYSKDAVRVKKFFAEVLFLDKTGKIQSKIRKERMHSWLLEHLTYERFDNIAGAIQLFIEELIINWITYWIKKTGITSITLGGGVFMNVKAAKKVYEIPGVTELFVIPSSGDESLAIGGLYHGNKLLNQSIKKISHLYLGREFSDDFISSYLETVAERYEFEYLTEDEMAVQAARLLADNKIVARCLGREEWGARALGNRSIMCNAKYYKNIDVLNQYIKSRDFWMPFTPSILAEDLDEYIVNPKNMSAPYMCISFDSTEKAREEIPAAIHPKDYTVRPQAVIKEWNPGYYKIITEFKN